MFTAENVIPRLSWFISSDFEAVHSWNVCGSLKSLKNSLKTPIEKLRWDDRREEMNQEEADQDVADEVSEEVDSRDEVMRSERNDW